MRTLLEYLATRPPNGRFQQWQISRVAGGANNLIYRVMDGEQDVAVKFTIRDGRRRAWREFQALQAIADAGLDIAPRPLLLDEEHHPQPVVVQTWLAGKVTALPPQTNAEWHALLTPLAMLHTITPTRSSTSLLPAVINFGTPAAARKAIAQQLASVPKAAQPPTLLPLLQIPPFSPASPSKRAPLLSHVFLDARSPALCHTDANTRNLIRGAHGWALVDWENSGWGDPIFDIVDMMSHPTFAEVDTVRWQWVMQTYAELVGDETAAARIHACYPLMLIWWAARLARMLYDVPRGGDVRLAPRANGWEERTRQLMETYIDRAAAVLMR